ncbi:MAG: hypothetical protein FWG55_02450 [Candidatus Bathyarchaeota archaeon]|nr:hypothetical protein [Candidatus Termiticorpusculum sp.]
MVKFTYHYGEDVLEVSINIWWLCSLYVNGQLQDKKRNWTTLTLIGKLESGEEIKAEIGNGYGFTPTCTLTVDDTLLKPNTHYPSKRKNMQ